MPNLLSLPAPPSLLGCRRGSQCQSRLATTLPFPRCPPTPNLSPLPASPSLLGCRRRSQCHSRLATPFPRCLPMLNLLPLPASPSLLGRRRRSQCHSRLATTLPFPRCPPTPVSSSFALSSGTSQPSSIFDTKQPCNVSKSNAFSDQLKKLYRDISHLESRLLADLGEPQDERAVWAAFPSLPFHLTPPFPTLM
jgi:hypothetical protein